MAKDINTADLVNVRLLRFDFVFRRVLWQEEFLVRAGKSEDPVRVFLATALVEVSGIAPKSIEEAKRVIAAIPEAILTRVWKVYRGSFPPARRFSTADLYQAPESSLHMGRVFEESTEEESIHDKVIREMENRFGKQEVAEEAELSRQILRAAQKEGKRPVPATQEGGSDGGA
jgi:pyruvoyl-dependent arginine decarboxylase (PvlArgDC)